MRIDETLLEIKKNCDKKRKLSDLSVTQDVLNLLTNIKIIKNEKILFSCTKNDPIEKSIFKFFKILGKEFQSKTIDEDNFKNNYFPTKPVSLSRFLVNKFEEDEFVNAILKSCQQSVVGLCLRKFKSTLMKDKLDLNINYTKDSWEFFVDIKTDQKGEITEVKTIHSREESILIKNSNDFNIQWELISKYNIKSFDIEEIELNLKNIKYINSNSYSNEASYRIGYLFENVNDNIDHSFNTKNGLFLECFFYVFYLIFGLFIPLKIRFGKKLVSKYIKNKKISIWDKIYFFSPSIWDVFHYPYFLYQYICEIFE
eukprot:gene3391-5936_t